MAWPDNILVSDFDGTMTAVDFYALAVKRLLTPDDLKYWDAYRAGTMTHFSALQHIFGRIRAPEPAVRAVVRDMGPDPALPRALEALRAGGWDVVVASAGCRWYIDIILRELGITDLEVYANPCTYEEGGPLRMEAPVGEKFYCADRGVDKEGIVRFHLDRGARVAYAGDGYTDLAAALLVEPQLRFARADLAEALLSEKEPFRAFSRWSEVAQALLSEGSGGIEAKL